MVFCRFVSQQVATLERDDDVGDEVDAESCTGDIHTEGEQLEDTVGPKRETARDDAHEDGAEREQHHHGE